MVTVIASRYKRIQVSGADSGLRRAKSGTTGNKHACVVCARPVSEHFGTAKSPNRWCPKPGGGFANTKYSHPAETVIHKRGKG